MKDLFSLEGRVAVVTGGSSGIGEMIARGLVKFGCTRVYNISVHDPVQERTSVIYIKEDLSNLEGIDRAVSRVEENETHIDILVNNAGRSAAQKVLQNTQNKTGKRQ